MRLGGWRARPGDRVVRRPRARELEPQRIESGERRRVVFPPAASALLALSGGFAALITVGTALLVLPVSAEGPGRADVITALFTATSAVCVTGLVVVSSADYWSPFGQLVLMGLMALGGLGIMTAGLVILVAIGRRITLNQRLIVRDTVGSASLGGAVALGRYVVIFALAVQAVGFVVLFVRFLFDFSVAEAAWYGLFHSVSAFNNAGFTIFEDSANLSRFQSDPATLAIIGGLVLIGAFSFPVIAEMARRRRVSGWSLDTRLVLIGTLAMWGLGVAAIVTFELTNDATLGNMSVVDKVSNGAFQALTARTAGFTTIDYSQTRGGTDFLFTFMMFIGGASGSVAGGIKVNTLMILVFAGLASLRGREHAGPGRGAAGGAGDAIAHHRPRLHRTAQPRIGCVRLHGRAVRNDVGVRYRGPIQGHHAGPHRSGQAHAHTRDVPGAPGAADHRDGPRPSRAPRRVPVRSGTR